MEVQRHKSRGRVDRLRPTLPRANRDSSPAPGRFILRRAQRRSIAGTYPHWFYLPAGIVFVVIFVIPTAASFYFSLTRWTLFDAKFVGLDNFTVFLSDPQLANGLRNTAIYAVITCAMKVVIGLLLASFLTSRLRSRNVLRSIVFFPALVSTVAVGITFAVLMHPSDGLINKSLALIGIQGPSWLTDPAIALLSVALVDVWQGVGIATVIFIAAIVSIPDDYYDTARLEGGAWARFRYVTVPLSRNAVFTVILLALIGGLRTFDLMITMTGGGPGFTTNVITLTIYQEYQRGYYGLATAGNVVLFIAVTLIVYPMMRFFARREIEL